MRPGGGTDRSSLEVQENRSTRSQSWASSWTGQPGGLGLVLEVLLTWGDHDLVLLGAHPQEGEVVLGVDVPDGGPGLHQQLVDQSGVLDRAGAVQGGFDGNS